MFVCALFVCATATIVATVPCSWNVYSWCDRKWTLIQASYLAMGPSVLPWFMYEGVLEDGSDVLFLCSAVGIAIAGGSWHNFTIRVYTSSVYVWL